MIDVASPSSSQRHSFPLSLVRQRRRHSADDLPGAHPEHGGRQKYRRDADHERNFPTLHSPKSFSAASFNDLTVRTRPPAPLKSP
jgi:hypothetical protein